MCKASTTLWYGSVVVLPDKNNDVFPDAVEPKKGFVCHIVCSDNKEDERPFDWHTAILKAIFGHHKRQTPYCTFKAATTTTSMNDTVSIFEFGSCTYCDGCAFTFISFRAEEKSLWSTSFLTSRTSKSLRVFCDLCLLCFESIVIYIFCTESFKMTNVALCDNLSPQKTFCYPHTCCTYLTREHR